ncbi:hypothetical protein ABFV99_14090 [Cytobacillus horneckiae]|uniref:hypothetical protein n=1 Tax=Cytobacillus horneckiae TaxID=549687 RepID=UPI0034CD954E
MTVQTYAPQYAPPQNYAPQPQYATQGNGRQSDPFWYRQNASYLYGVTNQRSNMQLGIEDISLKPASANQVPHGILFNGLLRTIVGSFSFQIRVSPRTQAPFMQTISTESGIDAQGQKLYWEHIIVRPQVKAQVLRFAEALMAGQVQQAPMQQQPMYGQQPQYGLPQQQTMYQQPQVSPQQYGYQQTPMQQQVPQFQQPAYQPPVPQDMEATQQPPADEKPADAPAEPNEELKEDDLPI